MQTENHTTFPEIWKTLDADTRRKVESTLYCEGYINNLQTVSTWATGKRRPQTPAARRAVAGVVGRLLGLELDENIFAREK